MSILEIINSSNVDVNNNPGTSVCQSCYWDYDVDPENGRLIMNCSNIEPTGFVRDEVSSTGIAKDIFDLDDATATASNCRSEPGFSGGGGTSLLLTCNKYDNIGVEGGTDNSIEQSLCDYVTCSSSVCVSWTTKSSDGVKAAHGHCACDEESNNNGDFCDYILNANPDDGGINLYCESCSTSNCNPILSGGVISATSSTAMILLAAVFMAAKVF